MSNLSLPLDPEAAAEPTDVILRRLARALDYAEGFWLGFAKCNSPAQRREVVAECRVLLEPLKIRLLEIELTEPVTDLLPVIHEHLSRHGDVVARGERTSSSAARTDKLAVFIYGLEQSIPSREAYPPILSALNLSRELFRQQLPYPLVLWLPDYALTALARKAPDFWAWRSGLYEFAPKRDLTDKSLAEVRGQAAYTTENLSEQAKRQRLSMLKGLLEDYRELGDSPREQKARANILFELGLMYLMLGELFEAKRVYEAALSSWRKLKDERSEGATLHELGRLAHKAGNYDEAQRLYGESLEIKRKFGNKRGVAYTLGQLGNLAYAQGNLAEARDLYDKCLEISKQLNDKRSIAAALHQLAQLAQDAGELGEARRLYGESLDIKKSLSDENGVAITLHNLGILAEDAGRLEEARRLYNESLELKKRLGNQSGIAVTLHQLGRLAQATGELEEARLLYGESLEIEQRIGNQYDIAITLWHLGNLSEQEGDIAEALRLYHEALGSLEKLGSPYAELARQDLTRVKGEGSKTK